MAVFGLEAAAASGVVDGIVFVVPEAADPAGVDAILEAAALGIPIEIAVGGSTRQVSVRRGLAAVAGEAVIVCPRRGTTVGLARPVRPRDRRAGGRRDRGWTARSR